MADEAAPARPAEGQDADLAAAAARIMALPGGTDALLNHEELREQKEPAPRDPVASQNSPELALSEAEQAEAARKDGKDPKAETPEGEQQTEGAIEGADLEFIEIPGAEEGAAAERVPLAEAVEAIKKVRALNGDIAAAVNQAEITYQKEQDGIIADIVKAHDVVIDRAEAALKMIPKPQMPSNLYLDENSPYYDPKTWTALKQQYDQQVALLQGIAKEREDAVKQKGEAQSAQEMVTNAREHERLVRVWGDDWKNPQKREAKTKALFDGAEKHFHIDQALREKLPFDHRIMAALDFAIQAKERPAKAVEVKKAVQAAAPKIVKGQATPERTADGRFQAGAMKRLSETGSREDAANAIKGLGLANIIRR